MKQVLVFDIDGTLAQTASYWIPVLGETNQRIHKKFGIRNSISESKNALKLLGKPDSEIYEIMFPGQTPEKLKELMAFANAVWMEVLPQYPYQLFQGALETIKALHKSGFQIFLSSNCDLQYLQSLPHQTGISEFITDAVCAEHFPGFQKWEFTREMLKRMENYSGYFIGDSQHDMVAGRKNNLTTVYAAYGYAAEPEHSLVNFRIADIRELMDLIK